MALPESDVALVEAWCQQRIPAHLQDRIRIECDRTNTHLTILECRPDWRDATHPWTRSPRARLRYNIGTASWSVYWTDRNSDFHEYPERKPAKRIKTILEFIDRDPDGIFWG